MTKSTMGLHVATGSRNGYGEVAPYARGILSFEHGAIDPSNGEVGEFTTTIYRDTKAWALDPTAEDSHYDADKPPNLEKMTEAEARANARVQWPRWKAINLAAPADAYQILNEVGGSWNPGDGDEVLERVTNEAKAAIAFEDEIMLLNEEDGHPFTLIVGSMAGDNPHWYSGIWQELWTPHIWKAWEMGHWYGRHAYTGVNSSVDVMINEQGLPADANVKRPFVEIDWFLENMGACGPIVLSECGYVTYPGEPKYTTQMVKYDDYIRNSGYDKWIGFQCLFTYGEWWNANIEDSSPELHAWMSNNVPTKWEPAFEPGNTTPPIEPEPCECGQTPTIKRMVHLLPQDTTWDEFLSVARDFFDNRNSYVYSHDDAIVIETAGDGRSVVYVWEPERRNPADLEVMGACGVTWERRYFEDTPNGEPVEPDPPTGETVNVKKYFEPPTGQGFGQLVVMRFTTGATQPQQLQRQTDGSCVMFKGRGQWFDDVMYVDYEHWRVQNGQVQKFIDTSDAGNGGRDAYNLHWAQWIPEVVQVGATYHSTPTVTRFNRTNCQVSSEAQASDYLTIKEIIPVWTSPYDESIKYYDVLVVEWRSGSPTGTVQETYKFAAGVGYIEWNNAAVGSTPSESNLGGELTGCYLA